MDENERDYDPPRRRRYRDEDDDEPIRRGNSKKGIGVGVILAIVFGVLFLCGGLGVALLLPAVSKVREAAARVKDQNNMKQIGLGMHNDNDFSNRGLFAPLAHDKDGNVVTAELSFRVSLLPYIEQDSLYRQFDLTQGWDSARNRPHSSAPVPTYRSPLSTDTALTDTPYRAFVGGGAMFNENGRPVRISDMTDGSMNTIMLFGAAEEVPWAAPRELRYSADGPLPVIGSKGMPQGTNVLLADGSVRFLKKETPEHILRALITRAGGETVPVDW